MTVSNRVNERNLWWSVSFTGCILRSCILKSLEDLHIPIMRLRGHWQIIRAQKKCWLNFQSSLAQKSYWEIWRNEIYAVMISLTVHPFGVNVLQPSPNEYMIFNLHIWQAHVAGQRSSSGNKPSLYKVSINKYFKFLYSKLHFWLETMLTGVRFIAAAVSSLISR